MADDRSDNPVYERARKRMAELRDFYQHLGIYLAVILGLFLINILASPRVLWFLWPAIGWGVFVLYHGLCVFFGGPFGQRWEERKTRQLMEKDRSKWGPRPPLSRSP